MSADFLQLMAQAAKNTSVSAKKIQDHRSRATTKDASTPSNSKMSAEARQAVVQVQLAKAGLEKAAHDSSSHASSSAPTKHKESTKSSSHHSSKAASSKKKPEATQASGSAKSKPSDSSEPLFRVIADRKASNVSSVAAELLREKREKAIAELKAAKDRPAVPREPREPRTKKPQPSKHSVEKSTDSTPVCVSEMLPRFEDIVRTTTPQPRERRRSPSPPSPIRSSAANNRLTPSSTVKKRAPAKPKGKPVDFSKLLNAAQANTGGSTPAQKTAPERHRHSDDDEPAGRFLIDGPRREIVKSEVHIKSWKSASSKPSTKHKVYEPPVTVPKSVPPTKERPEKNLKPDRDNHRGHSSARDATHNNTRPQALFGEERPASKSTSQQASKHPSQASHGHASSASKPTHQSRLDDFLAPVDERRSSTKAKSSQQSRTEPNSNGNRHSAMHSKPREVDVFSSKVHKISKASSTSSPAKVSPAAAQKRSAPGGDVAPPAKKKSKKKRFGPLWMQDEQWSDEDDPEADDVDVSKYIRRLYGYDKRKFSHEDPSDVPMESSWSHIQKEEKVSARLGKLEDLEEERLEEEREKKRKARMKSRRIDDDDSDD